MFLLNNNYDKLPPVSLNFLIHSSLISYRISNSSICLSLAQGKCKNREYNKFVAILKQNSYPTAILEVRHLVKNYFIKAMNPTLLVFLREKEIQEKEGKNHMHRIPNKYIKITYNNKNPINFC